ncbi:hypothetical protein [Stenotrophomonas sp. GD03657]|uniref:hypothetical protein n=1 Tax=Stenotrophomonas sp. GD03657 TaxID=2975363 RepID=UPI002447D8DF|nr:hypothetical protein [Stenotrophomonas sp. GD03657]MDH2154346.1 hypothetical protein [Stenotrophomonas sp. GD03657]
MSSNKNYKTIAKEALEAIAYQGSTSLLFRDLTAAFQACIDQRIVDQKPFIALGMGDIVFRHTGMAIQFKLDMRPGLVNACAMPIILDGNSPFTQLMRQLGYGFAIDNWTTTHEKILPLSRDLRGMIDLKKGRVSGVFSKIPTEIEMGSGLWLVAGLTAQEIAAICIHEIGHVFTYFEALLWTTTTNITLQCAKMDINKMPDGEQRLKLVFEVAEFMQVKLDAAEKLADPQLADVKFYTIFLAAKADGNVRSSSGSLNYDMRSSEVVADQFAARHGSGRYLVTALHKMNVLYDDDSVKPVWFHFIAETKKILLAAGMITGAGMIAVPAGIVIGLLWVFGALLYITGANPELKIYDDPKERLVRIRHDLVQSLKTLRYSPKERDILLRDLQEIDEIIKSVHDKRTVMNMLWILATSERRKQYSQMKIEQELEKLVDNDIFVRAAQLQSLQAK